MILYMSILFNVFCTCSRFQDLGGRKLNNTFSAMIHQFENTKVVLANLQVVIPLLH